MSEIHINTDVTHVLRPASYGLRRTYPLSSVLYYLRDVTARRADGTSKIARVAVAQTTVRL